MTAKNDRSGLKMKNAGFTLIEVMVVVIILGLLSALVAPKFFSKIDQAKFRTAKTQIEMLGAALDSFRLDNGRYPTEAEGLKVLREKNPELENWHGPYLPKPVPEDPWGNDYVYRYPGEHGPYDLVSYGQDGTQGGEGNNRDVVSWE